jgi:hypothetical protein
VHSGELSFGHFNSKSTGIPAFCSREENGTEKGDRTQNNSSYLAGDPVQRRKNSEGVVPLKKHHALPHA